MISNKDLFFVKILAKISANLDNDLRCKHAAMIVSRKTVLNISWNSKKSAPQQDQFRRPFKYVAPNGGNVPYHFLHAEIACLKHIHELKGRKNTLYVVRVDNKGNLANSKPCSGCEAKIRSVKGLQRVVYSVAGGIAEYLVE